jgi:hypothetical protein
VDPTTGASRELVSCTDFPLATLVESRVGAGLDRFAKTWNRGKSPTTWQNSTVAMAIGDLWTTRVGVSFVSHNSRRNAGSMSVGSADTSDFSQMARGWAILGSDPYGLQGQHCTGIDSNYIGPSRTDVPIAIGNPWTTWESGSAGQTEGRSGTVQVSRYGSQPEAVAVLLQRE